MELDMTKCYNAKHPIHKREYFGGGEIGVNWVINALSCVLNNVCGSGPWLVTCLVRLARRQGLHVESIIGVLGGRAEPLVKANWERKVGQELGECTSLPRGQQVACTPQAAGGGLDPEGCGRDAPSSLPRMALEQFLSS